ncbi:MAG: aminotransferase class III-fold pyridoxal phosphate-dependent enzyme [Pseudomonadota bacterium]
MSLLQKLEPLRRNAATRITHGLPDAVVLRFAATHHALEQAVDEAAAAHAALLRDLPDFAALDEAGQIRAAQEGFVNFYQEDAINPFVALAARGPWVVTTQGAVVHDCGGYGMLGSGHAPQMVLDTLAKPVVMANIMTPSASQLRLSRALRHEIGRARGGCPFEKFMCLNSGSESVSLAGRFADVNTRLRTDPGAPHAGWRVKRVAIKGAFHGRTELPALYSDSSRKAYAANLASYKHHEAQLLVVEPYDVAQLRETFDRAQREHWHSEARVLEPAMGEGNPGRAVPAEFYAAARELTREHGTLLLIDSIQAGLRAHGVLSVVDYPGFEAFEAPDMETFSKAITGGQYPLSVLAVNARTAALYRKGIYGNTMTTNPRAMEVACAVLGSITPELRRNVVERGRELVARLEQLARELPGTITRVQGTGLLVSCELAAQFKCFGAGSTEEYLRHHGFGVIHGGTNSLRFTPPFAITSEEIELLVDGIRRALVHGPRAAVDAARQVAA